ncbi:ribosome maturation factor RimP [Thermodesulfobacteriota bacterium]
MKTYREKSKRKTFERKEEKVTIASHTEILTGVTRLAQPVCESEGVELVHIEYQREPRGRILRIYIDRPGGVTLDDCIRISRQMNDLLDVSLEHGDSYNLEVSSPGSDRPLGKKEDYEKFKGNVAKIRTRQSFSGQKKFTGVLLGTAGDIVTLEINGQTVAIPYEEISRARLVNYDGVSDDY